MICTLYQHSSRKALLQIILIDKVLFLLCNATFYLKLIRE